MPPARRAARWPRTPRPRRPTRPRSAPPVAPRRRPAAGRLPPAAGPASPSSVRPAFPAPLSPRPAASMRYTGIVVLASRTAAHFREWQKYAQVPVLLRVQHAVLDAGRHQRAVLGVGHRVVAGGQPLLGGADPRIVAGLAAPHQLPLGLDIDR